MPLIVGEDLKVYASDDEVCKLNKELVHNNVKVYRIFESNLNLEEEFYSKLCEDINDKIN